MPAHGHPLSRHIFVLGGARSGKSLLAERLAVECGEPVVYVATAVVTDSEMAARIAHHRARRPATWRTVESPVGGVADYADATTVLFEDLTLLTFNLMGRDSATAEALAIGEVRALAALAANVIVVSNEVGMGVVPPYPLGRAFRDTLGRVNQQAAAVLEEVYLTVAGLPLRLK